MLDLTLISAIAGGVGLFLLGMRLMTNGLRKAAGTALRHILYSWTKTPLRGVFSGFLITALVQSSSAITVAVIGFVNAGILNLAKSVGVIYGSNIGTTVTGWIVAAVGVSVHVKALALPMIGIGAILRLTGGSSRRTPLGDALAGFGIFFLGIDVLQSAFQNLGTSLDLASIAASGMCLPVFGVIGFMLTTLMQSSSAAMAIILTATLSGVVELNCAAAAVIGSNIGTTSTALFSVIGATYNAKRVAAAHILFNLITGAVAFLLLPVLMSLVTHIAALNEGSSDPAVILALFHTSFNILGVILLLPFTNRLVHFLERLIGRKQAEASKPRYLDKNILATPPLALDALFMELGRLGEVSRLMVQKAMTSRCRYPELPADLTQQEGLLAAIRDFSTQLQGRDMSHNVAHGLSVALRVTQYYQTVGDILKFLNKTFGTVSFATTEEVQDAENDFLTAAKTLLNIAHTPCAPEFGNIEKELAELTNDYHRLKEIMLDAGAEGRIKVDSMADLLEYYSRLRRMIEQAVKGTIHWSTMRPLADTCEHAQEHNDFAWRRQ